MLRTLVKGAFVLGVVGLIVLIVEDVVSPKRSACERINAIARSNSEVDIRMKKMESDLRKKALASAVFVQDNRFGKPLDMSAIDIYDKLFNLSFSLTDHLISVEDLTSEQREILALYGTIVEGLNNASCYEISQTIVDALKECRDRDSRTWGAVSKSPLMLNLYLAFKNKNDPSLWLFVIQNQAIAEVVAMSQLGDNEKNGLYIEGVESLIEDMRFAKENKDILNRLFSECLAELRKVKECCASEESVLIHCYRAFKGYAGVFKTVNEMDSTINLFECYEVVMSNLENGDFLPEIQAENVDKGAVDVAKGVALCELRKYQSLWNYARAYTGVLVLSSIVGAKVVDDLMCARLNCEDADSLGLPMFLLSHYYKQPEDQELLLNAITAIEKYHEVALYLLSEYASNKRFRDYMADRKVGFRMVPLFMQCCSEVRSQEVAFEKMVERLDDNAEGWLIRCVDKDGNMKQETLDAIECLPLVGGIYGVAKHKIKGEAVTWGEMGWAAFDVAEIGITVLTFGTATPETTAAKTAAKAGAKAAGKATAKAIAKGGAKKLLTYSVKTSVPKMGRFARIGELTKSCIRIPAKICGSTWSAVKWSGGKAVEGVRWFRAQPKWVKMATLGVMIALEISGRNLAEKFPVALESLVKSFTETAIKSGLAIPKGIFNGVADGIMDCMGVKMNSRWIIYLLILAFILFFMPWTMRLFPAEKRLGARTIIK